MKTDGQQLALKQLEKISKENDYAIEIINLTYPNEKSPWLTIELSLYCGHFEKAQGGLPLRERERFYIHIPSDFPFSIPSIDSCHQRFAGWPHVQWAHHLCLYQSTETEWVPSDGMFGFINRLEEWLGKGALNELDPIGGALHPPLAYILSTSSAILVPQTNTPDIGDRNWIGLGKLERINDKALAINDWTEISRETKRDYYAPAILLTQAMPFEFPQRASDLVKVLIERGIDFSRLFWALQCGVLWKSNDEPLFLMIGTPMRGIRGSENLQQHLTAWEIDPTIAKILKISIEKYSDHEKLREIGNKAEEIIKDWAKTAPVKWCRIRENRDEIVTRRDYSSPMTAFKDKTISIWGCGALGAHIAIYLARGGAKKLIIRDNGIVTPGILVRQPFSEKDIGYAKAVALENHLKEINSGLQVERHTTNITSWLLSDPDWTEDADLVIDCSASNRVHAAFEKARMNTKDKRVPVVSMIIDSHATRGLAISIGKNYSGGILDAYRKALIFASKEPSSSSYADAFNPDPKKAREKPFQPEPGCSDPTFVGSIADSVSLSSLMLNACTEVFSLNGESVSARFITQHQNERNVPPASFSWNSYMVCTDQLRGYEIRISNDAWNKISESINQNNRTNGSRFETGGLLFGRRDDVLKLIWVDEASEPPPDSEQKPNRFVCGVQGVSELNKQKIKRTRNLVHYIGTWHTHPKSLPFPSDIDISAMSEILSANDFSRDKNLLLIAQPLKEAFHLGGFLFDKEDFTKGRITVLDPLQLSVSGPKDSAPGKIGLALSGGGSRAIAFHLGCLRALYDRGILDDIDVISSVSGGSIIAAMFAYSNDNFAEFDKRVVNLLRGGIDKQIVKEVFMSTTWMYELLTYTCGKPLSLLARITGRQPFMRRRVSRTLSFQKVLEKKLFGTKRITDERRNDVNIVINATELRTGTSFRFGSKESACWRLGKIKDNNVAVAEAVAASAAYPALFPAIDRDYIFNKNGKCETKRAILSDGGIYENLGVSCLLPGRNPRYSSNVFNLDYIISCNAGYGMFDGKSVPFGIVTRLKQTAETTMRKAQDSVMKDLHYYKTAGKIIGFVLPYLGQQDKSLPFSWPDLVTRDKVSYPTNFRPMKEEDLRRLTTRGEQLTRLLLDYYCPELW